MAAQAQLIRNGEEIRVTITMKLSPGAPMLDCEEQIREALDEAGKLMTSQALALFDADGSAIDWALWSGDEMGPIR